MNYRVGEGLATLLENVNKILTGDTVIEKNQVTGSTVRYSVGPNPYRAR